MNTPARLASRLGCLLSVGGPLVGVLLYPRARWLFACVFVGIAVIVLNSIFRKDPLPTDVADQTQRLLDGLDAEWDLDDYEHLNPRETHLRELWSRTMAIGAPPEEWSQLDETRKNEMRDIIRAMRDLGGDS